jgi:hypothetical protein
MILSTFCASAFDGADVCACTHGAVAITKDVRVILRETLCHFDGDPQSKKKSQNRKRFRLREWGDLSMWSTLFAFSFLIAVALSLAAIRLNL